MKCEECGSDRIIPAEPPVGTWVKDRHGATHYHNEEGWGAAPQGFYSGGRWDAMWVARGPLVECGPYGASTPENIEEP